MMKSKVMVKVGDYVCSDEGDGVVLAITKQLLIVDVGDDLEICLSIDHSHIWIHIDEFIQGGDSRRAQIDTNE